MSDSNFDFALYPINMEQVVQELADYPFLSNQHGSTLPQDASSHYVPDLDATGEQFYKSGLGSLPIDFLFRPSSIDATHASGSCALEAGWAGEYWAVGKDDVQSMAVVFSGTDPTPMSQSPDPLAPFFGHLDAEATMTTDVSPIGYELPSCQPQFPSPPIEPQDSASAAFANPFSASPVTPVSSDSQSIGPTSSASSKRVSSASSKRVSPRYKPYQRASSPRCGSRRYQQPDPSASQAFLLHLEQDGFTTGAVQGRGPNLLASPFELNNNNVNNVTIMDYPTDDFDKLVLQAFDLIPAGARPAAIMAPDGIEPWLLSAQAAWSPVNSEGPVSALLPLSPSSSVETGAACEVHEDRGAKLSVGGPPSLEPLASVLTGEWDCFFDGASIRHRNADHLLDADKASVQRSERDFVGAMPNLRKWRPQHKSQLFDSATKQTSPNSANLENYNLIHQKLLDTPEMQAKQQLLIDKELRSRPSNMQWELFLCWVLRVWADVGAKILRGPKATSSDKTQAEDLAASIRQWLPIFDSIIARLDDPHSSGSSALPSLPESFFSEKLVKQLKHEAMQKPWNSANCLPACLVPRPAGPPQTKIWEAAYKGYIESLGSRAIVSLSLIRVRDYMWSQRIFKPYWLKVANPTLPARA